MRPTDGPSTDNPDDPQLIVQPADARDLKLWRAWLTLGSIANDILTAGCLGAAEDLIARYPDDELRARQLVQALLKRETERALNEAKVESRLTFTEDWWAAREARLRDLCKQHGCWNEAAAILANGTASPHETPTYAQTLAALRAEVAALRARAEKAEADCAHARDYAVGLRKEIDRLQGIYPEEYVGPSDDDDDDDFEDDDGAGPDYIGPNCEIALDFLPRTID
jgi:hypothetical protein